MARAGIMLSENFGDLLEPGLRKIFTDTYNAAEEMRPMLYNVSTSSTSYEKTSAVGAFGDLGVFKGSIAYDDVEQLYDVTFRHVRVASGCQIERDLVEDELYGVIAKKPMKLARSANITFEKYAAGVLNSCTTGSNDIVVDGVTVQDGTEGQALISTSHPYSPSDASVQSNYGIAALSPTSVDAARLAMRAYKNDRGNLAPSHGTLLIVPKELEKRAFEIIDTKAGLDTAEGNSNFFFGRYKLAVWDYLSDANNWFMADEQMMKMEGLTWFDRIPLQFVKTGEFDTLVAKYAVTARVSFGYQDWRWVYGQIVA